MKGRLQWPFHIAIGVRFRFRSGHEISFTAESITIQASGHAQIIGYNWQGARGAPLYLDPAALESVVTDRVIRWRGWRAEPPALVVDVEANATMGEPINLEGSDGGPLPSEGVKLH